MATTSPTKMTIEEFLALPDDGVHRELIRGELREYPEMTTRNAKHAYVVLRVSQALANWFDAQTQLEGVVVSGDARCRLSTNPDNIVGIDIALFLGNEAIDVVERSGTFEGAPLLAVEVLSPTDTHENLVEKIRLYLDA
ncbi:MAG: Uma2 family endonuclease, partial [Planctomycetaceae bacterium]|nr:Uma2 family endonuclease [Planctomycetaceae bacterium]